MLVVFECIGAAPCSSQRPNLQAMGVLAQVVDCDGSFGGSERPLWRARFQLHVAQFHHGVECHDFRPLPLAVEPIDPRLLDESHIGEETTLVELNGRD